MLIYIVLQDGKPHSAYASKKGAIDCQETLRDSSAEIVATDLYGLNSSDIFAENPSSGYRGRG